MKIAPNNNITDKNLDFRLMLKVALNSEVSDTKLISLEVKDSTIVIEDKKNDSESGLDMDFEIERDDKDDSNICTLTIWNLSEETFNQIQGKSNLFNLYYARGDNDWTLLFSGVPYFATQEEAIGGNNDSKGFLKRDDAVGGENDIPTIIYLSETLNKYESTYISKSYQGSVSTEKIIQDCADTLGFPLNIAKEIKHVQVNNYVARGLVSDVLSDIVNNRLETVGVFDEIGEPKLTYDNNNVNIFVVGGGQFGGIRLYNESSENAYIQEEVFGYLFNDKNSTKPVKIQSDEEELYRFKTQLLPAITIGNYCKCDFSNVKGAKQIRKIVSVGNNYGTEGETEVTISV